MKLSHIVWVALLGTVVATANAQQESTSIKLQGTEAAAEQVKVPMLPIEPVTATTVTPTPAVPASIAKSPVSTPKLREATPEMSGAIEDSRIRLTVQQGVTDLVPIARNYMNHIETPFNDPKLISVSKLDFRKEGRSIYIATNSDSPVGVEIRSNDADDPRSISLALVPRAIPPRTVTLQFAGENSLLPRPTSYSRAERWEKSSPYEERLIALATATARGQIPDGYSLSTSGLPSLNCSLPNVGFTTGQRLTGTHFSLFVLRAQNNSASTMELVQDAGCNVPGLLFVAPYPEAYLAPGGETELYVIVSNERFETSLPGNTRPSLVDR